MNKRKVAVGPGASSLILIAVVLALSVLTVLTMISARNDEALALRSAETRQEVYGLFAEGERSLAKLDAALVASLAEAPAGEEEYLARVAEQLPEGMKMKGDIVSWTEKIGDRALSCAVKVLAPGAEKRTAWTLHRLEAEDIWEEDDFGDWEDEDSWEEDDFGDWEDEDQEAEEDEMNVENEGEEAQ